MTTRVKEAIEVLRNLPEDDQDTVAAAIIEYASQDSRFGLSDDQVAEVKRRIATPDRKLISLDQARNRLKHHNL